MDSSTMGLVGTGLLEVKHFLAMYGLRLFWAVVIFVLGRMAVRYCVKLITKILKARNADDSLISFGASALNFLLMAVVLIAALQQLGFETTSLVAILGALGLAVGLSLQGNLSNLAAGVMILVFKPFKLGHLIETNGTVATVEGISIINTTLKCADGRVVTLPNNSVFNNKITNFSVKEVMRCDLVVGIGYDDDIRKAKEVLADIVANYPKALKDPAPAFLVTELGDNSVNLTVRAYVAGGDYFGSKADLTELIKLRFDEEGISFPYPQRDVHMIGAEAA